MVFVRASRSATIRTRLDLDTVRERLSGVAVRGAPGGAEEFFAHGFFLDGGSVDAHEFRLDYRFNSTKNRQTYAVHGRLQDVKDWRMLRLKLTAHDPWLGRIELAALAAFTAFYVANGELPPGGAIGILLFVMAIYAIANLLYIPDVVTTRVAALLATEVNGSVQRGGDWVVPG